MTTLTFYFDHCPGMSNSDIWPRPNPSTPAAPGHTRYRVVVTVPDGCVPVDSTNCEPVSYLQRPDETAAP